MRLFSARWCVLGLVILCGQSNPPATSLPALSGKLGEPIQLYNGRDLTGWTWVARPPKPGASTTKPAELTDVWEVRNGLLHDEGTPVGYLRTDRAFDNYVLVVEQRHVKKGNGGILFGIAPPDKVWPRSIECQGQTGEEADLRGISNFKVTADPARTEEKRVRRIPTVAEKPPGEWETVTITVDHGQITVLLNGELANTATIHEPFAGQIGLQAEGGEMEFRKIELRPIEAAAVAK